MPRFFFSPRRSVEDLGLDGDIERRRRLVGNDELGIAGERHGDHHPLPLPAAELVRVVLQALFRRLDAHVPEQLDAALGASRARAGEVDPQRLSNLIADREDGVERGHGLLKDHGDSSSADLLHGPFVQIQQVLTVEEDRLPR